MEERNDAAGSGAEPSTELDAPSSADRISELIVRARRDARQKAWTGLVAVSFLALALTLTPAAMGASALGPLWAEAAQTIGAGLFTGVVVGGIVLYTERSLHSTDDVMQELASDVANLTEVEDLASHIHRIHLARRHATITSVEDLEAWYRDERPVIDSLRHRVEAERSRLLNQAPRPSIALRSLDVVDRHLTVLNLDVDFYRSVLEHERATKRLIELLEDAVEVRKELSRVASLLSSTLGAWLATVQGQERDSLSDDARSVLSDLEGRIWSLRAENATLEDAAKSADSLVKRQEEEVSQLRSRARSVLRQLKQSGHVPVYVTAVREATLEMLLADAPDFPSIERLLTDIIELIPSDSGLLLGRALARSLGEPQWKDVGDDVAHVLTREPDHPVASRLNQLIQRRREEGRPISAHEARQLVAELIDLGRNELIVVRKSTEDSGLQTDTT